MNGMAMTPMTQLPNDARRVLGGVDTHKDLHVAAALDELGRLLGTESFPTTAAGYRQLWRWPGSHGEGVWVVRVVASTDTVGEGLGSTSCGSCEPVRGGIRATAAARIGRRRSVRPSCQVSD